MLPVIGIKATQTAKKVVTNKYVIGIIVLVVVLLFSKKKIAALIQSYKEKKFDKNETKAANQLAQQYRSASNPSGISWMIDMDGTDEEQIDRLAYQSKGRFKPIADAYQLKFGETLTDRMRKELDSEELQNWRNIIH